MIRIIDIRSVATTSMLYGILAVGLVAGCNSDTRKVEAPPPKPAASSPPPMAGDTAASGTMTQFRNGLVQSQAQLDSTLASLSDLMDPKQQDLRGAYDKYCDQLARMNQHADMIKHEAEAMRTTRGAYFGSWEEKVSDIDNPTIRASAEARRKRLRDAHEQIITAANDTKDAYVPFMKDLQDIKKYLASDLSKGAIADLGDASKKVQADGANVRQKINVIIKTLDDVQGGNAGA